MRPYAVRTFLWAGLVHEDPELTPEKVGQYIDVHNIQEFSEIIYKAILSDKPEAEPTENENSDKKK